jgi:hypothetical protein
VGDSGCSGVQMMRPSAMKCAVAVSTLSPHCASSASKLDMQSAGISAVPLPTRCPYSIRSPGMPRASATVSSPPCSSWTVGSSTSSRTTTLRPGGAGAADVSVAGVAPAMRERRDADQRVAHAQTRSRLRRGYRSGLRRRPGHRLRGPPVKAAHRGPFCSSEPPYSLTLIVGWG